MQASSYPSESSESEFTQRHPSKHHQLNDLSLPQQSALHCGSFAMSLGPPPSASGTTVAGSSPHVFLAEESCQDSCPESDAGLLALGYKQELSRSLGLFSNFAISFSIMSVLTGLTGLYTFGFSMGGPAVVTWGWVLCIALTMTVAASMAEICSAYPTAGGVYFWTYGLAPDTWKPLSSWLAAWMNLVGQGAVTAGIDMTAAQTIVSTVQLGGIAWQPSNGIVFSIFSALLIIHGFINMLPTKHLRFLDDASVWWHIVGTVVFSISLLAAAPTHQSASYVLTTFDPNPALPSPAYSFLAGLLMSMFTLTGYDASAKVAEESHNASRTAPLAILLCVSGGGVVGFVYLLSITFSIQDPSSLLDPKAAFGGSSAVAQVVHDVAAARFPNDERAMRAYSAGMFAIPLVAQFFCGMAAVTSSSRTLYAFARDRALPGAFSALSPRAKTPNVATWTMVLFSIALGSPLLGSFTAFTAVTSIATIGIYISYGIPIFFRVFSSNFKHGPVHLGRFGPVVGIIACLWIGFLTALLVLPTTYPVTAVNLNYASIILGGTLIISLLTWFSFAFRWFDGPNTKADVWQDWEWGRSQKKGLMD